MNYHAVRLHPSFKPDWYTRETSFSMGCRQNPALRTLIPASTITALRIGTPASHKAAAFQLDLKFNKAGWHFPAVAHTVVVAGCCCDQNGTRTPEPFFFRANTN